MVLECQHAAFSRPALGYLHPQRFIGRNHSIGLRVQQPPPSTTLAPGAALAANAGASSISGSARMLTMSRANGARGRIGQRQDRFGRGGTRCGIEAEEGRGIGSAGGERGGMGEYFEGGVAGLESALGGTRTFSLIG